MPPRPAATRNTNYERLAARLSWRQDARQDMLDKRDTMNTPAISPGHTPTDDGEPAQPYMSGKELWLALGYRTAAAFSQAARRGTTPIPVFDIPGRRGKHALHRDVLAWQDELRQVAASTQYRRRPSP